MATSLNINQAFRSRFADNLVPENPSLTGFVKAFYPFRTDGAAVEKANGDIISHFPEGEDFVYAADYSWIFYASIIFGFFTAYGIGANDVANAFATSVGAKALKVWQAVIIAAIFEFAGAVGLGSAVTDTVRKKIVDFEGFQGHEDWLMIGMLTVVIVVGFWLFAATTFELPVSTTHSAVGGIIGFALCVPDGVSKISWTKVRDIVISWFASPGLSGIVAALIYFVVRALVLRHDDSFNRTLNFFPILVGFTIAVNAFYVIVKGAKVDIAIELSIAYSLAIGAGCGLLVFGFIKPVMKARLEHVPDEPAESAEAVANAEDESSDEEKGKGEAASDEHLTLADRLQHNIHDAVQNSETVSSIHDNAEKFSLRTERAFAYLQVFTAIFDSFSHGANDVANSIGPLAAVYAGYISGPFAADESKVATPIWIIAIGGAGIVVGLATYGYKIMSALGVKMVKVTPTRGFAIELGAAFVIVTGSYLGLPLSTTHCQVGATIGVGLCENNIKQAVNWGLLAKVFAGWVFTLVIAGAGTALLFSFAIYSPSLNAPVSSYNCLRQAGVTFTMDNSDSAFDLVNSLSVPLFEYNETFADRSACVEEEFESCIKGNGTAEVQFPRPERLVTILVGNPVTGEVLVGSDELNHGKNLDKFADTFGNKRFNARQEQALYDRLVAETDNTAEADALVARMATYCDTVCKGAASSDEFAAIVASFLDDEDLEDKASDCDTDEAVKADFNEHCLIQEAE